MGKRIACVVSCLLAPVLMGGSVASTPQGTSQSQTLQQFYDQVLLMVAPIEEWSGPARIATATGFFFTNEGKLYLITNRHVVRDDAHRILPDKLRLRLHTNAADHTQNADYDVRMPHV